MKKPQKTRVGVISLGCAKNLVDTEVMLGHLERAGCTLVADPSDADVIVVNTCGFIGPARQESIDTILDVAEHKKSGTLKRLVVAGCMVQRYAGEMKESLPEVDAFIGLDELHRVSEAVTGGNEGLRAWGLEVGGGATVDADAVVNARAPQALKPPSPQASSPSVFLYDHDSPRKRSTPPWTAYVKIAEGCDHTCSFCAIPSFRGAFRSRSPEDIVAEARTLARSGVVELNLISQDTTHYGRDRGDAHGLSKLLEQLNEIDELRWIRLHYLYPNTVNERFIETMARLDKVVPYVDMPLQHAHADTLRRMRRGGSAESHLRLLEKFRKAMPEAALRTTLIVGFPGESEAEFAELIDFVKEARFDHLGAFTYSHEEGTTATEYADDIAERVKEQRRAKLMKVQQPIAKKRLKARLGQTVEVLVEGTHPDTDMLLVGRMATQAIEVDGQVLINEGATRPGEIVQVELTEVAGYDLVGGIVA